MNVKTLKVQMLGGFELVYGDEPLVLERSKSTKASQLLQYIIYHKDENNISRNKLLKVLYARDNIVDPGNNLKVTIFRLRKLLGASGLPKDEYITFENGFYNWKCAIPMEIDAHSFTHFFMQASLPDCSEQEKLMLFKQAIKTYTGEFLPVVSTEEWVAFENIKFKKMYLECVYYVCKREYELNGYSICYDIAEKAVSIYPYEESLYMIMIKSMVKMNRFKEMHALYNRMSAKFFDDLGVPLSKELEDYYKDVCAETQGEPMTLFDIKKKLSENSTDGAYFCNYLAFMESYHIITRIVERCGQSVFLMLCSLEDATGGMVGQMVLNKRIKEAAEGLHKVIRSSIRRGDIYSRYSKNQFLVLLTGINQENCAIVSDRIYRKYCEEHNVRGIRLYHNIIAAADFHI